MRNKAFGYVERHFDESQTNLFRLELDKFLKSYELEWANQSKVFSDTLPCLNKLREIGYQMGIVTNTSEEAANRMLSSHGIRDFFMVIITREDVKRLKPDPEGILIALKRLQTRNFVFVGDLIHDSRAAEKAGGISVIVKRDIGELSFHSDYVVRSLKELVYLVQTL